MSIVSVVLIAGIFVNTIVFAAPLNEMKRKIIVFKDGVSDLEKNEIIKKYSGEKIKNLSLTNGTVVVLPDNKKIRNEQLILRVDDDILIKTSGKPAPDVSQMIQVLPWGIDRVDAELVWPSGNLADPIKVGIIDTGISNKHPDLMANIKGGINTINPQKNWNDDNGHGSHVAGIVAAVNNSSGVIGVAPRADLYAIKSLNANGSGYLSDIIEGIEWGITNNMQVLNMSLGTTSNIQSFHDAVIAAKNAGVVVVAAAGNSGGAVNYPAAYSEVIAVSATDQNNNLATWSSRGAEVDLAAPGVSVYSTYKGTGYATLSGTSMAAPHVAATAALVLNMPIGLNDLNQNGKWDPDEVQKKMQDSAVDLGGVGFDNIYGWGLVNAYLAIF